MDIRITHVIELSAPLMALLASGVSGAAIAASSPAPSRPVPSPSPAASTDTGNAQSTDTGSADVSGEVDAAGWPWSADMHAATKGKTKEGMWRMKVGVSRPDPKPGFPKADGASANGEAAPATSTAEAGLAASQTPAPSASEDDDEFAAFRNAVENSNATDAAAAASAPARKWTDADLGALCNQAAVKLGDPQPVKDVIAKHVPEGQVAHSRNVPEDKRAAFAAEVEKVAGITFGG